MVALETAQSDILSFRDKPPTDEIDFSDKVHIEILRNSKIQKSCNTLYRRLNMLRKLVLVKSFFQMKESMGARKDSNVEFRPSENYSAFLKARSTPITFASWLWSQTTISLTSKRVTTRWTYPSMSWAGFRNLSRETIVKPSWTVVCSPKHTTIISPPTTRETTYSTLLVINLRPYLRSSTNKKYKKSNTLNYIHMLFQIILQEELIYNPLSSMVLKSKI